jgi:hypothetical protein
MRYSSTSFLHTASQDGCMIEELGNKIIFFGSDIPGSQFKMKSMRGKSLSECSACAYDH